MKTYVVVAQAPDGSRKMVWIYAETYQDAKLKFSKLNPDHVAISMWLRVRT